MPTWQFSTLPSRVGNVDAALAVLDLAEPAAPLPRHSHRLGPLLGERRGVEDDHAVRLPQVLADLTGERGKEGRMVPRDLPDELLDGLSLLIVQVSDPLASLMLKLGEKAGHVLDRVSVLLGLAQGRCERVNEGLQPPEQTP